MSLIYLYVRDWRQVPIEWCPVCEIQAAADHVCVRPLLTLAVDNVHPDMDAGLERIRRETREETP
jgi:hypothetical protein